MTYKKIVQSMVEDKARFFVSHALEYNDYKEDEFFLFTRDVNFEHDKESDTILWDVDIDIHIRKDPLTYRVRVGGTVDDMCGVCYSVIWNRKQFHEIMWMSASRTREELGIDKFDLTLAM